jgi:hypothetical protein
MRERQKPAISHRHSTYMDLVCALTAASTEQVLHPFDTVLRRIQLSRQRHHTIDNIRSAVFTDSYNKSVFDKITSLYQGFFLAAQYKFLSRVYRFSAQFYFERHVHEIYGQEIRDMLDGTYPTALISASVGAAQGLAEVMVFHPIESLKTKRQIGDRRPTRAMFKAESPNLYKGFGVAIARSMPSNFVLFGVHEAILAHFGNVDEKKTLGQHVLASLGAAWANAAVTNPMDVIKTRVQAHYGEISSLSMFRHIIKEEGWYALTRGIPLKLLMAGPKFMLPLIIASYLPEMWDRYTDNNGVDKKAVKRF